VKFRDAHHQVALLFAMGHSIETVMEITGYSYGRITTLRGDPAFQDLIARKREKVEATHIDANEAGYAEMTRLRQGYLRHLGQHLEEADEAGETVSPKTALAIAVEMADRTGLVRHSTNTQVQIQLGTELEERIRKFNAMRQIEAQPTPQTSVEPKLVAAAPAPPPLPFKRRA